MEDGFECVAALTVVAADQGVGGVVRLGLGCPQLLYVSLISQFISQAWLSGEPLVLKIHQELSAGHHNWEMRLLLSNSCRSVSQHLVLDSERWQNHITESGTPSPSPPPLPLPLPSSEIRCGIKVTLTDITFLFFPFTFCLPNETFPLLQRKRFVIAGLHRCEQIAVGCTLTLGPVVVACLFSLSRSKQSVFFGQELYRHYKTESSAVIARAIDWQHI